MRTLSKFASISSIALAAALTFSCSTGGGGGGSSGNEVKIGEQVWMKKNLDVDVAGSKCYDNDPANCDKYGRLYDWATAMALPSSCNDNECSSQVSDKHQGICPDGWHIPSNADWDKLYRYADGTSGTTSGYESLTAGKFLKSANGWDNCGDSGTSAYSCEDAYGFAAMPGGLGDTFIDGDFYYIYESERSYWWSATERSYGMAHYRFIESSSDNAKRDYFSKERVLSVRCIKD